VEFSGIFTENSSERLSDLIDLSVQTLSLSMNTVNCSGTGSLLSFNGDTNEVIITNSNFVGNNQESTITFGAGNLTVSGTNFTAVQFSSSNGILNSDHCNFSQNQVPALIVRTLS
jgi:hypothetical protein